MNSPFEKVDLENLSEEERNKYLHVGTTPKPNPVVAKPQPKDPEAKTYVVFIVPDLKDYEENEYNEDFNILCAYTDKEAQIEKKGDFNVCVGRTAAYNYIKNLIVNSANTDYYDGFGYVGIPIDLLESSVLVEGLPFEKKLSIYNFMVYCEKFYVDEDFDIDDYIKHDDEDDIDVQATGVMAQGQTASSIMTNENNNI